MANRDPETRAPTDLGERVIDVHHHWLPPELVERLEHFLPPGYRAERRANGVVGIYDPDGLECFTVDPERWCRPRRAVGRHGRGRRRRSAALRRLLSSLDHAAGGAPAERRPGRPAAPAPPALRGDGPRPAVRRRGALAELQRAARELGLRAVCVTTNFGRRYPDDEGLGLCCARRPS